MVSLWGPKSRVDPNQIFWVQFHWGSLSCTYLLYFSRSCFLAIQWAMDGLKQSHRHAAGPDQPRSRPIFWRGFAVVVAWFFVIAHKYSLICFFILLIVLFFHFLLFIFSSFFLDPFNQFLTFLFTFHFHFFFIHWFIYWSLICELFIYLFTYLFL